MWSSSDTQVFKEAMRKDMERFKAVIEAYKGTNKKIVPTYFFTDNTYSKTVEELIINAYNEKGLSISIIHWTK